MRNQADLLEGSTYRLRDTGQGLKSGEAAGHRFNNAASARSNPVICFLMSARSSGACFDGAACPAASPTDAPAPVCAGACSG